MLTFNTLLVFFWKDSKNKELSRESKTYYEYYIKITLTVLFSVVMSFFPVRGLIIQPQPTTTKLKITKLLLSILVIYGEPLTVGLAH